MLKLGRARPVEESWDLALNCVTVSAGKAIINAGSPTVVKARERNDVEVIQGDSSVSHRFAIAGLHCATLELQRDQAWPGKGMAGKAPPCPAEG